MPLTTANFANLLFPGLKHVFYHDIETWKPEYSQYLKVDDSLRNYEYEQEIVGIGSMPQKAEGTPTIYYDPGQGYRKQFTHTTYSAGINITQEMYEDDLYGIMKDMTTSLARSARQRVEVQGASLLNNAFSSSYTGPDGVALISASHVQSFGTGGTQGNALSAEQDLSASSLQEAVAVLEKCKDEQGLNLAFQADLLVVPTDNQFIAQQLLRSAYMPGTADNDINPVLAKNIKPMVCHYLTDTDSWFLLAGEHKLRYYWRRRLQFYKGNDFDTDNVKFKASMRLSTGFVTWRGVTGSQGA